MEEVKDLEGQPQHHQDPCALEWHVKELAVRKTVLLSNIAGRATQGDFLVILGPSGAGKTSLLECLALRNRDFVGALHWDGKTVGSDYYTKAALVYQEELLFSYLTPREHLLFHAAARMHTTTAKRRAERVEEVLESLDLLKCANTNIGGFEVLYTVKGISGGERKRLCIATELLLSPSILFLDEPTSGLDSYMAEGVAEMLKGLAEQGVLVVSSMHSPSSTIAQHFSHVLLLTPDGRAAYQGPYDQVGDYLASIGRPIPKPLLPSDYMLWVVSRGEDDRQTHATRLDEIVHQYQKKATGRRWAPLAIETGHHSLSQVSGPRASMWTFIGLNIWRTSIRIKRQHLPLSLMTSTFAVLGVLFGILYYGQVDDNWRSMMGSLYLTVIVVMLVAGMPCMLIACLEWPRLTREYLSGSNSLTAALLGYFYLHTPYMLGPIIFATIMYWMSGFTPSLSSFLMYLGITLLIEFTSASLCILIGASCPIMVACVALASTIMVPMTVFAGVLYQRSAVPWYLTWLHDISIVNFGFAALLGSQARKLVLLFCEVDPSDVAKSCGVLALMSLTCCFLLTVSVKLRLMNTKTHK